MENEESCINLSTVLSPEPALKTAPVINKGRIQCRICFTGTLERNIKREGIQKMKDIASFKEKTLEWKNITMNTVQYTKILIDLISKKLGHTNLAKEAFLRKLI